MTLAGRGMSEAGFRDRLEERVKAAGLGISLSPIFFEQFVAYFQLLRKWNRRINLTALPLEAFPGPTLDRIFVESLVAADILSNSAAAWFDLGSGSGSPAVPLKIVRPAISLTLVESRSKKAAFLREAVSALGLQSAKTFEGRIEELPERIGSAVADLITMRAVKIDAQVAEVLQKLLRSNGRLFLFRSRDQRNAEPSLSTFRESQGRDLPGGGHLSVLEKL